MSDCKPGTVAVATVRGVPNVRVFRLIGALDGWATEAGAIYLEPECARYVTDVRPLVVLDPEDRQQVTTLAASITHAGSWVEIDDAQAALRSLVKPPKPPKPAEPTGLGAVVEDSTHALWTRNQTHDDRPWRCGERCAWAPWRDIDAVRVLSEGVQP